MTHAHSQAHAVQIRVHCAFPFPLKHPVIVFIVLIVVMVAKIPLIPGSCPVGEGEWGRGGGEGQGRKGGLVAFPQ